MGLRIRGMLAVGVIRLMNDAGKALLGSKAYIGMKLHESGWKEYGSAT